MRDRRRDLLGIVTARKDEPRVLGTVIDETDTKVKIRWASDAVTWDLKRDIVVHD